MIKQRWRNLSTQGRVASVASAAAAVVWIAVAFQSDAGSSIEAAQQSGADVSEQRVTPARAPASERLAAPAPARQTAVEKPQVQAPRMRSATPELGARAAQPAASSGQERAALQSLRNGLASENSGTRIEALRAVAQKREVSALSELFAFDVASDPEVAPTLIQVTSQLAQVAAPAERAEAAAQLTRWMRAERRRQGADARGNLSVLVEALSGINSPDAETGLVEVLNDSELPLHVQTLAVEGLSRLGTSSARAALTAFRAQLAQSEREGFELELQHEAEQATDRALARLSR